MSDYGKGKAPIKGGIESSANGPACGGQIGGEHPPAADAGILGKASGKLKPSLIEGGLAFGGTKSDRWLD